MSADAAIKAPPTFGRKQMESELSRSVACYDKRDDKLVFDIELDHFPIDRIRPFWETGEDKEMICIYKIERYQMPEIRSILPKNIEFEWNEEKYEYFLECHQKAET